MTQQQQVRYSTPTIKPDITTNLWGKETESSPGNLFRSSGASRGSSTCYSCIPVAPSPQVSLPYLCCITTNSDLYSTKPNRQMEKSAPRDRRQCPFTSQRESPPLLRQQHAYPRQGRQVVQEGLEGPLTVHSIPAMVGRWNANNLRSTGHVNLLP